MKRLSSSKAGLAPAPTNQEQRPEEILEEREIHWKKWFTSDEQWVFYRRTIWNRAYAILKVTYDADVVTDEVIDDLLEKRGKSPSKAEIEKFLYQQTWRRSLNRLRNPRYKLQKKLISLIQRDEEGEEYDVTEAESHGHPGAEEELFSRWDQETRALYFDKAVRALSEHQRICFLGRMANGIEYSEIAESLNISVDLAYQHVKRARNKISKLMKRWEQTDE